IGVVEQPFGRWRDALAALLGEVQDMNDFPDTLGILLRPCPWFVVLQTVQMLACAARQRSAKQLQIPVMGHSSADRGGGISCLGCWWGRKHRPGLNVHIAEARKRMTAARPECSG